MTINLYPAVTLKQEKESSVLRFHPWIFSGAIKNKPSEILNGQIVEVFSSQKKYLATGHYFNTSSISVRIISFEKTIIDQSFWNEKIKNAFELRKLLGLINNKHTNAFRLVNAEGDNLSGLIIDIYNETAVIHTHTAGMSQAKNEITNALIKILSDSLKCIYHKNLSSSPPSSGEYLLGNKSSSIILENGHSFYVDWEQGQKTGFFLDQRENRKLISQFTENKTVLNAYCYSGGFSIYALKAGALLVDSVDSSEKAITLADKNVTLNKPFSGEHKSYAEEVMNFLKNTKSKYDVIVIDPPAFAKHKSARHNAIQGYIRLASAAIARLNKNGILFTFSCSQFIDKILFEKTIMTAAIESGRKMKIVHRLSQPPDHPVNIYHPEGEYLKGLVLSVE